MFPVCKNLGVEVDNFVIAHNDVGCVQFRESTIVDNIHRQLGIPAVSSVIVCVPKTNDIHRTNS
jgi:hypothetical protein